MDPATMSEDPTHFIIIIYTLCLKFDSKDLALM